MKQVIQLDSNGYYVGLTTADESPLETGVYLMPANSIDASVPTIPDGYKAKWDNAWVFEAIASHEPIVETDTPELTYVQKRFSEYPPMTDYLDGIVKGDQAQIDKYIADCLAVKAKYPKP